MAKKETAKNKLPLSIEELLIIFMFRGAKLATANCSLLYYSRLISVIDVSTSPPPDYEHFRSRSALRKDVGSSSLFLSCDIASNLAVPLSFEHYCDSLVSMSRRRR